MRKSWVLSMFALLLALVFISGCAKKSVVKEGGLVGAKKTVTSGPSVKPRPQGQTMSPAGRTSGKSEVTEQRVPELREVEETRDAASGGVGTGMARGEQVGMTGPAGAAAGETTGTRSGMGMMDTAADKLQLADIRFDFDKYTLNDEAREVLKQHAAWLNERPRVTLVIEGHCDERGSAEYNLALGERRANSVARYLTDLGIDSRRIRTVSYGKELPLDPRHTEEAWVKNRRAHFVPSTLE